MENIYEGKKILVPLFFEEVLRSFSFLRSEYEYNYEWGIDTWERGELKQVSKDDINNEAWYFSVVRFTKNETTLSITYGGMESTVSSTIAFNKNVCELWELIHAISPNEERRTGNNFVSSSVFLISTIQELKTLVRDYWNKIEYPSIELLEKVKEERSERYKLENQAARQNDIERACYRATEEFHKKNYGLTIEFLKAYESELPPSALLKLQYARKRQMKH